MSRVTDPANFCLVGLPPWDILEELATALREHGLDVDQVFERSVKCSNEFIYDPCRSGGLKDRFDDCVGLSEVERSGEEARRSGEEEVL